ncbi:hypothetical protein DQ04_04331010 [Trypanosoma grayi]|uniref:hypothetical protein n=1 Tax=Trypanosoma grayi TaxID=71804 RepID=UPI0004F4AF36|nr:hypothetical protein DQ04_04331010 [Trypanosoma grayi]KEG09987.1 hypothetical protein DQ04_04331010 [Trypanosoma grayi]
MVVEEASAPRGGANVGDGGAAIPLDEPLTASVALMEQLGVLDLAERRTQQFAVAADALDTTDNTEAIPSSLTATITEACKAGAACRLPPVVVLQKVITAAKMPDGHNLLLPPVAAAVLLRYAAERITAKAAALQRCLDGRDALLVRYENASWPRSDQGEAARLRWALSEEVRHGYNLLARLQRRKCNDAQLNQYQLDELRARLQLAAALQDSATAADAIEDLLALHAQLQSRDSGGKNVEAGAETSSYLIELARDVGTAITAFRTSCDFLAGCRLWEKFLAADPWSDTVNPNGIANSGGDGGIAITIAAEKLRLLSLLAECIDANVTHFTYVRDSVVRLFTDTDVGYFSRTVRASQEALCAVLLVLSRVTLEPGAKMDAAQSFFCAVQQATQADVCLADCVTEALLQVASAARDSRAALLLYNQLSAPKVRRAEVPANMAAMLVAEGDALHDGTRYLSFVSLRRRVIASAAAHLLAAKLLLQQKPSEVVYSVLDLIETRHEVDPQRTFFLRLLVFNRDLEQRQQQQQQLQKQSNEVSELPSISYAHAQRILEAWREELRTAGITTIACTTLQLLQRIRRQLTAMSAWLQQPSTSGEGMEDPSSLLACVNGMLSELSLGWLRHRAAPSRTPLFHLKAVDLDRMTHRDRVIAPGAAVAIRMLHNEVMCSAAAPGRFTAEQRRAVVQKTFDALYAAADTEGATAVVLGFSDYVRLCWLEDSALTGSGATTTGGEPYCSLERLNRCVPLLYVTDALGEAMLPSAGDEKAAQAPASLSRDIHVDVMHVSDPPHSSSTVEEKWLARWLEEISIASPVVRGVFERHLALLLREAPLATASSSSAAAAASSVSGAATDGRETTGERKPAVLQWFVSAGVAKPSEA